MIIVQDLGKYMNIRYLDPEAILNSDVQVFEHWASRFLHMCGPFWGSVEMDQHILAHIEIQTYTTQLHRGYIGIMEKYYII